MSKLISIKIKQDDFSLPTPEVLQEQNLAIYDLEQCNEFQLVGFETFHEIKLKLELFSNYIKIRISDSRQNYTTFQTNLK